MAKKRDEWTGADAVLMSDEDFAKIQSNSDAWFAAQERGDQAAMDALHDDSERIRSKYNYSGGTAGIEYNKLSDGESGYRFASNESRPSSYTPQYAQELKALTNLAAPAFQSQYAGDILALTGQQAPTYTSRYDGQIAALGDRIAPEYASQYDKQLLALRDRTAPEYASKYNAELEEMTRALLSRDPFSYDPKTDPQYAAYQKQYAREGQRAAANTLGEYAAMTGGMPSTAAVTASQQAGNYYGAKMADVIPQLYQAAYQMYLDEQNQKVRDINALRQLEDSDYERYVNDVNRFNTDRNFDYSLLSQLENNDYNRYLTELNQWNADRNFDYARLNQLESNDYNRYLTELNQWNADRSFDYAALNQLDQNDRNDYLLALNQWNTDRNFNAGVYGQLEQDAYNRYLNDLGQWNTDRAFEYGQERDAVEDQRYEDETAWNRGTYADETAYNRALTDYQLGYQRDRDALSDAMSMAQLGAAYGDYSGLGALGITPDAEALLQMELAGSGRTTPVGSGGGGGNGGSGSGGSSASTFSGTGWEDVDAYAAIGGDPEDYIKANYKSVGDGYSSQSAALAAWNVRNTRNAAYATEWADEADKSNQESASRQAGVYDVPDAVLNALETQRRYGAGDDRLMEMLDGFMQNGKLTREQRNALILHFNLGNAAGG